MKKLLSILFVLAFCLMAIAAPAMAQLTFQSEPQTEEAEPLVDDGMDLQGETEVSEGELANARMTFDMVAKAIADFKPSNMYQSLSEMTKSAAFAKTFWKPDMTAQVKTFLFDGLKAEISNLDSGTFLEDSIRKTYNDEKAKADLASAGIEWISDTSFDLGGFMTMTVTGNTYVYTDATGKENMRFSLATGPKPDSILVTFEQNSGAKPTATELILTFEDETILISRKDETSGDFVDTSRISFDETNLIKVASLKDDSVIEIRFIPEDYQVKINTPKTISSSTGEPSPAAEIILEINPEKNLLGLTKDSEKLLDIFFYPEDKEISIVSPSLAEATKSVGGTDSITLKFDDATTSAEVVSGEASLLKLGFNDAESAIDVSFAMGGDAGMMSGMSLTVDREAKRVAFTMMGMELFSLVLDTSSETAVMNSLNMQTMENEEMVMTIEDIALFLRSSGSMSGAKTY